MGSDDDFAARLRVARKRRGLNQTQLGELMHVTKQAVAAWEQARNQPNAGQVARLCEHLRVDANFLVLGVQTALSPEAVGMAVAFDAASDETKKILRRIFAPAADDAKVAAAFGSPPQLGTLRRRSD
jgi:transcriptional regulator with XRE-family HTH domain